MIQFFEKGGILVKEIIESMKSFLKQLDYKKKGNTFIRIKNEEFYNVIIFRKGAYGNYFFLDWGVHPIELPQCIYGNVTILEKPQISECSLITHERDFIEILKKEKIIPYTLSNEKDLYLYEGMSKEEIIELLKKCADIGEKWFERWSDYEELLQLKIQKGIWESKSILLKVFCYIKLGDKENAEKYFDNFLKSQKMDGDKFKDLNAYVKKLIEHM